jgi:DNA-directed RNA polymerase subunit omega
MSVVDPTIDDLLSVTGENRFLLCEVAARRACDINDMMRNQHNRAQQLLKDVDPKDVSSYLSDEEGHVPNPLSIAFDELAPRKDDEGHVYAGKLSFDAEELRESLGEDIHVNYPPQDFAQNASDSETDDSDPLETE